MPKPPDQIRDIPALDEHAAEDESSYSAEAPDAPSEHENVPVNLPVVAATSLFAKALDKDGAPAPISGTDIIIVEAPDREWVRAVADAAPAVLLGWQETRRSRCDTSFRPEPRSFAVIQHMDVGEKAIQHLAGEIADLLGDGRAAIVVTFDITAFVPAPLRIAADHLVILSGPSADWLEQLAMAATGQMPNEPLPVIPFLCVKPGMLSLARRKGQSPEDYLRRLEALAAPTMSKQTCKSLTLAQLHGMPEAVAWGRALARDLAAYRRGQLSWSDVDRGALFCGPPGTGKTTVARAIADHCAVPFFPTSYAAWQSNGSGHLGDVTRALRDVFAAARKAAPSIVFIDELDSLPRRDKESKHADWWQVLVNTLLSELDGAEGREGVVITAASNYPELTDPALRRAGRLDKQIPVPLPSVAALNDIIAVYFRDDLPGEERKRLAHLSVGHTGADVEQWARGARRRAREAARGVIMADVMAEIVGDVSGYSPAYLRRVAVHEAGHALVITLMDPAAAPTLILGRNGMLAGETRGSSAQDEAVTIEQIDNHLAVLLAGRSAELVICGDVSAGAGGPAESDLARATRLAAMAEASFGLGETGLAWSDIGDDMIFHQQMAGRPGLERAVRQRLDRAFDHAVAHIRLCRHAVEALAEALIEHKVLPPGEVAAIIAEALGDGGDMAIPRN